MTFGKYSGAGNKFAIAWKESKNLIINSELIQKIVGQSGEPQVDGVVFLNLKDSDCISWDFFNSDGSSAEMCGNAARCVSLFLKDQKKISNFNLETIAGDVQLYPQIQKVIMSAADMKLRSQKIELKSLKQIDGDFINSGVPHFLVDENKYPLTEAECREIRSHQDLAPAGANVTLYLVSNPVLARTFERGVEGFTLACGTGAIAVAKMLQQKNKINETDILMPGGRLHIRMTSETVELSGDTEFLTSFEVEL